LIVYVAVVVAYLAAFLQTPIGALGIDSLTGRPFTRIDFQLLLVQAPSFLIGQWTGGDVSRVVFADRIVVIATAALLVAACYAPGRLLLRGFRVGAALTRFETVLFSLAAGLNLVSLWTLFVGLAGGLGQPIWFWSPLAFCALVEAVNVCRRQSNRSTPPAAESQPVATDDVSSQPSKWLWMGAPFVVVLLLLAALPPWSYDARCYHLQAPKEWHQAGQIGAPSHNVYANMPLGAEMHVLMAMELWLGEDSWWWGALVGKVVIAFYTLLTAGLVYAAGRRLWSDWAGAVGALLYLSTPWIMYVSTSGLIDGVVGCYLMSAALALLLARRRFALSHHHGGGWGLIALAGWLAGSAAACKYPALIFVVAPTCLLAGLIAKAASPQRAKWNWKRASAGAALLALTASAAFAPWFVKNAALLGNPTYPLMSDVFGDGGQSVEENDRWREAHATPRDAAGWRFSPRQLIHSTIQVTCHSNWLNPILLPMFGFAFFARKQRWEFCAVVGLIAVYFAGWWLLTHRIDRFWLPAVPLLALVAAGSVELVRWRPALHLMLLLGLMSNFLVVSSRAMGDNRMLVSLEQLRDDEPRDCDALFSRTNPVHRYLNRHASTCGAVLLVGDAKPFDLEMPVLYNTTFDKSIFAALLEGKDAKQRRAALRAAGITHVFVYWHDIDQERSGQGYGFTDFVTRRRVRQELVDEQGLLEPIDLGLHPDFAELFKVAE
jgi:hypothetical protein